MKLGIDNLKHIKIDNAYNYYRALLKLVIEYALLNSPQLLKLLSLAWQLWRGKLKWNTITVWLHAWVQVEEEDILNILQTTLPLLLGRV